MSLPNIYNYRGIIATVIDVFYVCRPADPSQLILEKNELTDFIWSDNPRDNLDNMAFHSNRLAIEHWLSSR